MIRVHGDVRRINVDPLDHKHSSQHGVRHHERQPAQALRGVPRSAISRSRSTAWRGFGSTPSTSSAARARCSAPFRARSCRSKQLNAPKIFGELALKPRGVVLVTGPTGSGKSTTLAAMVNYLQ